MEYAIEFGIVGKPYPDGYTEWHLGVHYGLSGCLPGEFGYQCNESEWIVPGTYCRMRDDTPAEEFYLPAQDGHP
jgi:hypothetical protein